MSELEEVWRQILEFPKYAVSNLGNVHNLKYDTPMSVSRSNHGHAKVSLIHRIPGSTTTTRHTCSVALLVAEAFLEAPSPLFDSVVVLNGDLGDVRADNLVWRPNWFAWRYRRQITGYIPEYYRNLKVTNLSTGVVYNSVYDAGITEGVLFNDIWHSTYTGRPVFPKAHVYAITHRV